MTKVQAGTLFTSHVMGWQLERLQWNLLIKTLENQDTLIITWPVLSVSRLLFTDLIKILETLFGCFTETIALCDSMNYLYENNAE